MNKISDKTAFLLVTCSRDITRSQALERTVSSLLQEHKQSGLCDSLYVFDNASTDLNPLQRLESYATIFRSAENIGYWGALLWMLRYLSENASGKFSYVHPLESDLILYDAGRLIDAINFLEVDDRHVSVRTQEFSVRWCWRYYKESPSWFRKRRSVVSGKNFATGELVSFKPVPGFPTMYTANWHAKVPALHRLSALRSAFEYLAKLGSFAEGDFMSFMHGLAPIGVGVLNGGVYYDQLSTPGQSGISGSYTSEKKLLSIQYFNTRISSIWEENPIVDIDRSRDF